MFENITDKIIQKIIRRNMNEGENEKEYWERHWKNNIEYFENKNIPIEINDLWWKQLYDEMHDHYKKTLGNLQGQRICELGCGSGYSTLMMAVDEADITLVDFTENSAAYSRVISQYLGVDLNKVTFINDDAFSKDLEIGVYDVVWNCGVVEHYDWDQAIELIKVMASHVKSGGKVMVTLPNLLSPQLIYKMIEEGKGSEIYYTHRKLKKIMEEAGLVDVKVKGINYWVPSFLPPSFANFMRKVKIPRIFFGFCWLFNGVGVKM